MNPETPRHLESKLSEVPLPQDFPAGSGEMDVTGSHPQFAPGLCGARFGGPLKTDLMQDFPLRHPKRCRQA